MPAEAVTQHAVPGLVVDLAGVGRAGVVAEHHAQIGAQRGVVGQRLDRQQAEEMLAVHVIQLAVVVAAGEVLVEGVFGPGEGQVIGLGGTGETAVLVVQLQVLGVGRSAVDDLVQAPADQRQAFDILGSGGAAFEHLRQRAAVAGLDHRHLRDVRAIAQLGLGDLRLGGQAQAAELVRGAAIVLHRQEVSAGATTAGVQLDAEHAQRIQADADGAFGEAGLHVEDETLGPLFALGLGGAFAEIAVQVDVVGLQSCTAVFDERGLGERRQRGGGNGESETSRSG